MDDFKGRARDAAHAYELQVYKDSLGDDFTDEPSFIAGANWARAEMQAIEDPIGAYLKGEIEIALLNQVERALQHEMRMQHAAIERLKAELAAAKRDNATLNLANHLPPRPRCPDCGIESLYGSVHTEECIKTSELREELSAAKEQLVWYSDQCKGMALDNNDLSFEIIDLKAELERVNAR